jgi:hypothetical protein
MTEVGSQWFLVERSDHLIGANLGPEPVEVPVPGWATAQLLAMTGDAACGEGSLRLGPESTAVWSRSGASIEAEAAQTGRLTRPGRPRGAPPPSTPGRCR